MNPKLLTQAQAILSPCGYPTLPGGFSAVPIPKGFLMAMVLQPGASTTYTKEITGTQPWVLRAISSDQASASLIGIRIQIQLPNGKFLFGGNGVDVGQFAWIGSYKWLQDPELRCEPGQKFSVTLTDTTSGNLSAATAVNLLFEGARLYFLQGGVPSMERQVSQFPRYQAGVNQNILAPAWMSGEGIDTPAGFLDDYFMYSSFDPNDFPNQTTFTLSAGAVTTYPIPLPIEVFIDPGYEFHCYRILPDLQVTITGGAGASMALVGRLRAASGYVLNDNMIDLARYICGAELPKPWVIQGGDSVYLDADLVDRGTITGTATIQIHLEGYRRRRA